MSYIYEYGVKFQIIDSDNQNTTKSSLEKIFFMMLNSKKKCFMSQLEIVNKVNKKYITESLSDEKNGKKPRMTQSTVSKILNDLPLYLKYNDAHYVISKNNREYSFAKLEKKDLANLLLKPNEKSIYANESNIVGNAEVLAWCQLSDMSIVLRFASEETCSKVVNNLYNNIPDELLLDALIQHNEIKNTWSIMLMLNSENRSVAKKYMAKILDEIERKKENSEQS